MLADLQRDFRSWLVSASDDAAMRFGAGARAGLAVYQNNYRGQLVDCLELSFPQVRTWMGEEAFRAAAIAHIDSHPPHAWTLDAYARDFPATLAAIYPDNPDLQELAWIEQALSDAFVGPDAEPLSLDLLATIDWDAARLRLTPTLMSRPATTNAEEIWTALQEERVAPEGTMLVEAGGLIVWRRGFVSYLKQVDAIEYEAVLHLGRDGSFAALCGMLADRLGEADGVAKAGALLANWLGGGLIVGVED
ncbi:MAG TPA: DNA-binding domain-containing protein [Aliidongia sp.]|nr:DNA-binding domain-containing protein [Aliidongia sp.]